MDDNKKYSPYHGCLLVFAALILVPVVAWLIFRVSLDAFQPRYARINPESAKCLGCLVGSFFHISCIVGGVFRSAWRAFCYRVKEFFENLPCGLSFALQCYWEDMKQDGVLLLPYAAIVITCLVMAIQSGLYVLARL